MLRFAENSQLQGNVAYAVCMTSPEWSVGGANLTASTFLLISTVSIQTAAIGVTGQGVFRYLDVCEHHVMQMSIWIKTIMQNKKINTRAALQFYFCLSRRTRRTSTVLSTVCQVHWVSWSLAAFTYPSSNHKEVLFFQLNCLVSFEATYMLDGFGS